MFDFLRDIRKSEEEKRQEALSAYLDGVLTPAERERFERLLSTDESLRASLEEQRMIRASLAHLPRVRAPRNFTLDPALYGAPANPTAGSLYPIMRAATAVVAILFVVVLVIDFISFGSGEQAPVDQLVAMSESPAEPQMAPFAAAAPTEPLAETQMVEGEAIEVTRVITEADEMAVEAPAEEAAMADEIAEDEAAEEGEILSPENVTGGGGPAGDEAEAEEPPLALEMAPDNENVAAAPEPELAMAGTSVAARETVTTALTKEALASQPTASPMASLVPPGADGQVASRSAAAGSDAGQLETGFSTGQILAVILGLFLIVLLVLTLLLRRQTR